MRAIDRLIEWFDYQIVYRAFVWRFNKKFAASKAMRDGFSAHMADWGDREEARVVARRRASMKIVKSDFEPGD